MLSTISNQIIHATHHIYIHGEDERIANAVVEILCRDALSLNQLEAWAKTFSRPDGTDWKGAYVEENRNRAYQNTRNLLRSMYLALISQPEEFADRDPSARLLLNTLDEIKRY